MANTSISVALVLLELTALLFPVVIISLRLYLEIQGDSSDVGNVSGRPIGVWAGYLMVGSLILAAGALIGYLAMEVEVNVYLGSGMLLLLFALLMMLALTFGITITFRASE